MKIIPTDKSNHPSISPAAQSNTPKTEEGFAGVLKKTMDETSVDQKTIPAKVTQSMPPTVGLQPLEKSPKMSMAIEGTLRLLDTLDQYQQLISDPKTNLRTMHPLVMQLQKDIEALEPLIEGMENGQTVKGILTEALIVASKEVVRFNSGEYNP